MLRLKQTTISRAADVAVAARLAPSQWTSDCGWTCRNVSTGTCGQRRRLALLRQTWHARRRPFCIVLRCWRALGAWT
eukprot:15435532-Alexandrium_andersonii.AAC.1